ncbi:hypothetical protein I5677_00490 [Mobilitalea sibirica]|uniref:Uncharacterized protein n=1 Tax=Mobilitalea sibirica TaxID=1462919 RepID=A0A8J7HBL7_9FIRM|nr:hypothetical protein [Mobilitalea sibirica]MBH1939364.1 hypothetical protein [Mobilitalea sibirica]
MQLLNKSEEPVENRMQRKRSMLPFITIFILIAIISVIHIAKLLNKVDQNRSIPAISNYSDVSRKDGLNDAEMSLMNQLSDLVINLGSTHSQNSQYHIYYNYLNQHLRNEKVDLSIDISYKAQLLVNDLINVLGLESRKDLKDMSFDGRRVVVYLSEEIYKLCGLSIDINVEGEITQISDSKGHNLYISNNAKNNSKLNIDALMIILGIILTLIITCIIIARKNRLFVKEVIYNGFDEKEFA